MGREYQRTAARDAVSYLPGVKGVTNSITLKATAQPTAVKDQIEQECGRPTASR